MAKIRRPMLTGDGLTERRFEIEELVAPVTQEEIEEYHAFEAECSGDRWWTHAGDAILQAEARLAEIEREPPKGAFDPHVGEGWYCRQLVDLGRRISKFVDEYEVASSPLADALRFGKLLAEMTIRREHNTVFMQGQRTRERQSDAGRTSRRVRPWDDEHTLKMWDSNFARLGGKVKADKATATEVGISPRTMRDLRLKFGR